jgi:uncharacterized protein (TIGR03435 family)
MNLSALIAHIAAKLNAERKLSLNLNRAMALTLPILCGVAAMAQTRNGALTPEPNAPAIKFEVATIKLSPPEHLGFQSFVRGDRYTAMTATLRDLVEFAYHTHDFQISGGPAWSASVHYEIAAKMDPSATPDQVRSMLQSLLQERFHLGFHRATKNRSGYALVIDKNGPKFVERKNPGLGLGMGRGHLTGLGASMEMLANELSSQLESPIVNQTGLNGIYNFTLTWTPDELTSDAAGPSVFSALKEQMGLKLVQVKEVPVEELIIDHVERPSEN